MQSSWEMVTAKESPGIPVMGTASIPLGAASSSWALITAGRMTAWGQT